MDILDEIDAALNEKKNKWNYAPMREKNETDAIIDELLREFSPESNNRSSYDNYYNRQRDLNEEQQERIEYESAAGNYSEPQQNYSEDYAENYNDSSEEYENYEYSQEYQNQYVDEYDEQSAQEYAEGYSDEDDSYDDEYDEEYDEYENDSLNGGNTASDFNRFMDAENDGQKGDLSGASVSALIKTILKIAALAILGTFTVLGVINVINSAIDKYGDKPGTSSEDTSIKSELQSVIYPVVVTEVEDFENVSELSDEDIINICVWELVINGDKSVFKDEESGEVRLPQDQMTYIAQKLFGDGVKIEHKSAGVGENKIEYNKKNKWYVIPDDTDLFSYSPKVTDLAETGDTYTVYADCYGFSPSWNSEDESSSKPEKRVMITLNKTEEYYNIVSMKTIPVE